MPAAANSHRKAVLMPGADTPRSTPEASRGSASSPVTRSPSVLAASSMVLSPNSARDTTARMIEAG